MKKNLIIPLLTPLNKLDTIDSTYGCRHSNADICSNNGIIDKCAFCSDDCMCKCPPRSWKKQYERLLKEKGDRG